MTVLHELVVGEGDEQTRMVLDRYDWRDRDGNAEPPQFSVVFERGNERLDWAAIPASYMDAAIAALARLKRMWNPDAARVQPLPPFDVKLDGGSYMADAPMVPVKEHEYDAEGLHVQAFRGGDSSGVDRLVGIAVTAPHAILDWPFYFTPESALQLADDIRDTALALIADAEAVA